MRAFFLILSLASIGAAQQSNPILIFATDPSGACPSRRVAVSQASPGRLFYCNANSGLWQGFASSDVVSALSTPAAPTVTNVGTAGVTSYSYRVVSVNSVGHTLQSSATMTTTGNATLGNTNYNNIATIAQTGSTACYVYRAETHGFTLVNSGTCGSTISDKGAAANFLGPPLENSTAGSSTANLHVSGFGLFGQEGDGFFGTDGGTGRNLVSYKVATSSWVGSVGGVVQAGSGSGNGLSIGAAGYVTTAPGSSNSFDLNMDGVYGAAYHSGSGTIGDIRGLYTDTELLNAAGHTNTIIGNYNYMYNAGITAQVAGSWIESFANDGTISQWYHGYHLAAPVGISNGVEAAAYYNENMTSCGGDCYAWKSDGGENSLKTGSASTVGMKILGATSQTADLQDWTDANEVTLAAVASDGKFTTPGLTISSTTASTALDFPSINDGNCADLTMTLTGAAVGDKISPGWPSVVASQVGLIPVMIVSATNTVLVRICNFSSGVVDLASATYKAVIIK